MAQTASSELGQMEFQAGELREAFQDRREAEIDFFQTRLAPDPERGGAYDIAANLYRGTNLEWANTRLNAIMEAPRGDMFWMFPFTTVMFNGVEQLPESTQQKVRDVWRTYQPYRGDTENHWALYYATLYLAAQKYPGEPGETWFTGKSSQENFDEAEEWLHHWMDLTTTRGQGEYDSSHYLKVYIAPMALLYAYAEDPEMRLRAEMMLDYITADWAVELLAGHYGGGHSRVYEREAIAPGKASATRFAGLFFGQAPHMPSGETFIAAVSGYEPPLILHAIATDRSAPYTHRETKRTRHRFRFSEVQNAPVYKTSFVRPEYILGSTHGGLLQPIQQQTWGWQWAAADRVEARNVVTSLHPYASDIEMGMYFAELREFIVEIVVRSKREYDSPDKITGGSPYEQVMQHEDALIALYDIAPDDEHPHINAFFPDELAEFSEDESGWIFGRGGDGYIAVYPLQPYEWQDKEDYLEEGRMHRLLYSPHVKNGLVVQTAPVPRYRSMAAFQEAVRALPLETLTEPVPSVQFTTLSGHQLEATYGVAPVIDGEAVDYEAWPLFDGPFAQAAVGSRQLELRYGPLRRMLDFNTLSIREWVVPTE
ncbi:MAG: hypothetical protein Rubg2KO_21360 [Rubricoccaceae bacterium]